MDALQCLFTKRETRDYRPEQVPEELMKTILEVGRLAGSAKNRQPWDFILLRDPDRLSGLSKFGQSAQHMAKASFAVVIVIRNEYMQDPFDAGRVAQNMMLAAHALGVGSCPVTLHDEQGARQYLGVPAERRIQVCVAFGYPVPLKRKGKVRRRLLDETLHLEKW